MYPFKAVSKVPGDVAPVKEKTSVIGEVSKLSRLALLECIDRQNKLLANKSFISKLPDKGEKIKRLKQELDAELERRDNSSNIVEVMAGLTLDGKKLSENLEWEGKLTQSVLEDKEDKPTEVEGDESDPLRILASHSSTTRSKSKIHKEEPAEESLIKDSDLKDISDNVQLENYTEDPYVVELCHKLDNVDRPKARYLPHRTLKESKITHSSPKLTPREICAAYEPPVVRVDTKIVSLEESIRLQVEQNKLLKEVQLKHATERLNDKSKYLIGEVNIPVESTSMYRESPPSDSEEEVGDESDPVDRGGVTVLLDQ